MNFFWGMLFIAGGVALVFFVRKSAEDEDSYRAVFIDWKGYVASIALIVAGVLFLVKAFSN
ncbi:MAG: hypothetical protein ACJA0X_002463 [Cyclobacteriaceae bacterium]|jgi:hypothetical protein